MARRTKLTPQIQQAMANAITVGVPFKDACQLSGIGEETGAEWVARGEGRHRRPCTPLYAGFAVAITQARAQDLARRVARIHKAGEGGTVVERTTTTYPDGRVITKERYAEPKWEADAWHLERTRPEQWGRKDRLALHVQMRQAAEKVAAEKGITVEEVLAEAQALLHEVDA